MGASTFSGPLKAGTVREGADANVGSALMVQSTTVTRDATLVQTGAAITLPANCEIVDMFATPTVFYDSATSATLSVGTAAAGTQFASGVNVKTGGPTRPTTTAAQAALWRDIGATNLKLYPTVTSVGQPSVGTVTVSVVYRQR
jgi:hypothetical protein